MTSLLTLTDILPEDSELSQLLTTCSITHELHLHELNDGALVLICFSCPFHRVLDLEEEGIVRGQMEQQGITQTP